MEVKLDPSEGKDILDRIGNCSFVVYNDDYLSESDCKYTVLLIKLDFWSRNIVELWDWLTEHNCTKQGMTVNIPDDERMMLFALRWS
jgi:hypothetical protein